MSKCACVCLYKNEIENSKAKNYEPNKGRASWKTLKREARSIERTPHATHTPNTKCASLQIVHTHTHSHGRTHTHTCTYTPTRRHAVLWKLFVNRSIRRAPVQTVFTNRARQMYDNLYVIVYKVWMSLCYFDCVYP